MATAEELRRLREEQSIFSALYDMARQQQSELAAEGRRPVLGGLLSKEPVYGTDTLRYEGIGNMLVGLLSPAAKAVDAPISAYRGTIPQEDMISEALGVGGLAMLGGGAVGVPRGAVGANALRGDKFFAQDEIDIYTRQARNPKSRETLTYMSPQDFLALAKKTTAGEKTEKTRKLLREGTQFESIPFLSVQNQGGGNAKVVGHEGRNRMMALAEAGVESVPVRLNMTGGGSGPSIRWGEALDPNSFDYVDPKDIPVRVINEDENMVYSMPDSVVSPITQAAAPSSDLLPLGGYRKPERRLSKEEQDIEDQINESILFDILRDYDTTAANASKSAGLLTLNAVGVPRGAVGANAVRNIKDKYPDVEIDIYGDADRGYELGRIQVPKDQQSSGVGSQVMNDLIAAADAEGAKISLTPDTSFGGTSVSRLKDFYKRFGFVENKGRNKDFSTRNTMYRNPTAMANASKSAGLLTTAASEAQDMAKRILELRAEGRASEVTDEMMAQADPQYMFANTPLPMDEASRMARAEAAGFDVGNVSYHGTKAANLDRFNPEFMKEGLGGKVIYSTDTPKIASGYAGSDMPYDPTPIGSGILPLLLRGNRKAMPASDLAKGENLYFENVRKNIQAAKDEGFSGMDLQTTDPTGAKVQTTFDTSDLRSRFARFDPEFAHLSNLSAANVSPLGGLLAQSGVSDKQAERIEEYLRRRGLLD